MRNNNTFFQGLIDPKKELEKLKKKEVQLTEIIQNIKQAMSITDYCIKVPLDVQKSNEEKMTNSEGELQRIVDAITAVLNI